MYCNLVNQINHSSAGTLCTILITPIKKGTEELAEIKISKTHCKTVLCLP